LRSFGVSAFVAHENIEPTKWQDEIEKALLSMNALAAILMPGFHESKWTDQERSELQLVAVCSPFQ
jgi:hypothetical protein